MDDINTLFSIVHTLNTKNIIAEKTVLEQVFDNNRINRKKCISKNIKKTIFFMIFNLKSGEKVIIKEEPKTFFQGYSILIGDQTKLIKGIEKKSNQIYYFQEDQLNSIKEKINFSSIRSVPAQILNKKEYYPIKNELEIISSIKEYSKENLDVDLNVIHLVKHNKLEVFAPTLNDKHNSIGHLLKIPIKTCISKKYFIDTTIHIDDEKTQNNILNPLLEIQEEVKTLYYNKTEVSKKLQNQLHITINRKEIIDKLQYIEETNIDLKNIIELLKTKKTILLSNTSGEYIIPLFKNQNFKSFPSKSEFKEETGVEYANEANKLTSIKVRKNTNEDYAFKKYYLNPKLKNILKSRNDTQYFCENLHEVIVYIICHEKPTSIFVKESINLNHVSELTKHIFSLSKFLIHKSVEFNFIPKEKRAQNAIEHYLLSKSSQLQILSKEYSKNFSKIKLLKETLKTAQEISEIKKTIVFEKENLYFLHQCLLVYISILKQFNKEKANLIEITLEEYFQKQKIKLVLSKINKKNDIIIKDISLANKLSKKKKYMIELKKDLYKTYFSNEIILLPNEESFSEIYYRANIQKLKHISPYNYKNIAKTINGKKLPKTIVIQKKEIPLSKEYYFITRIHNSYKEVLSNEVFSLFVKNE